MIKYEHVDANLDVMAKIVSFENKETMKYFSMHFHNSTELLYCERGSLHVRVYDQEYVLKKGVMIFINSNVPHETKSVEPNHVYMIQIKHPFIDTKTSEIFINTRENSQFKETADYAELVQLLKEMYDIHIEKHKHYQFLLNSRLEYLKYRLLQCGLQEKQEDDIASAESHLKLTEIMRYIDDNYKQGLRVSDVADYFDYTVPYFSALFKEKTGVTCNDYIQRRRLREAMNLLIQKDKSIIDVSYDVGFSNVKSMRRLFKQELGVTPSEYIELYYEEH